MRASAFCSACSSCRNFLHDARAPQHRRVAPRRERGGGGLHRRIDQLGVRKNDLLRNLAGRGVEDLAMAAGRRKSLPVDPYRDGFELGLGIEFSGLVHRRLRRATA